MTMLDDYLHRVRSLLSSVATVLTAEQQEEVSHLIDHGEPAEALRALAWIVVEENKRIPVRAIGAIRELTAGLVDEQDLPENLNDFAAD